MMPAAVFPDEALTDDRFLSGRLILGQPVKGYRAATDAVFLAAACPAQTGETVLDLGCGAGAASLCLAARVPGVVLAGLEVQPEYADLARRNAARNDVVMEIETGDLTQMPKGLRRGFDHVIANPPWYPQGGTPSPLARRDTALRAELPVSDWVQAAARRLSPGGSLTLIAGADSLPVLLAALAPKLGSAAVLPLAPREGRAAPRVILRARKGGRAPFRLLAPFVVHDGPVHDGDRESYSRAANAILRDGGSLLPFF